MKHSFMQPQIILRALAVLHGILITKDFTGATLRNKERRKSEGYPVLC